MHFYLFSVSDVLMSFIIKNTEFFPVNLIDLFKECKMYIFPLNKINYFWIWIYCSKQRELKVSRQLCKIILFFVIMNSFQKLTLPFRGGGTLFIKRRQLAQSENIIIWAAQVEQIAVFSLQIDASLHACACIIWLSFSPRCIVHWRAVLPPELSMRCPAFVWGSHPKTISCDRAKELKISTRQIKIWKILLLGRRWLSCSDTLSNSWEVFKVGIFIPFFWQYSWASFQNNLKQKHFQSANLLFEKFHGPL